MKDQFRNLTSLPPAEQPKFLARHPDLERNIQLRLNVKPKEIPTRCSIPDSSDPFTYATQYDAYNNCIRAVLGPAAFTSSPLQVPVSLSSASIPNYGSPNSVQKETDSASSSAKFRGQSFGLGFGFSFGGEDFIDEAVAVDGVVRVTKDVTNQPRLVLEYHRFFFGDKGKQSRQFETGHGPFLAIAATGEDVLSGVGLGWMYGWKSKDPNESEGFSVGFGAILDRDVTTLAEGFEDGQPLPNGESTVRLSSKSRWSWLVFVTRTF